MSVHTTPLSWRRTLTPFVVACTVVTGGAVRASAQDAAPVRQAPSKPGTNTQAPQKPSTPPAKPAALPAAKAPAAAAGPVFTFQGFGSIGYTVFAASETFDAVLGSSGGLVYGGGVTITHRRGYFGRVGVEHFSGDGERVFVFGGEVFPLGIPLSVSMTPIDITGGYRFLPKPRPVKPAVTPPRRPTFQPAQPGAPDKGQPSPTGPRSPSATSTTPAPRKWIPYVGGGVGFMSYEETSEFAEAGENVSETFTTYHLLGGVEYRVSKWIGATGELGWRLVPNALEDSYVGQQFGEKDLGGFTFRALVTVGR